MRKVEKKPVAEEAEVEAPLEVEAPSVELKGETAAAAFQAAFNGTGYFNTTGSEHATRVGDGLVRLELLDGDDRRTVTVRVPFAVKFLVEED